MRQLFFYSLFILIFINGKCCELCGCNAGQNIYSILPQYHHNFIGIKYFRATQKITDPDDNANIIHSASNTIELWGRFYPHKRIQVLAFVPFHFFSQTEYNEKNTTKGLGDISLIINYNLIKNGGNPGKQFKQAWFIGAGFKVPTGKFNITDKNQTLLVPGLQTGTGSMDYILNSSYTIRHKEIGMSADILYNINTKNKNGYQFGNQLKSSLRFFYWKQYKNDGSLLPSMGVQFERFGENSSNDGNILFSGGSNVNAFIGTDLYYKKLNISISYSLSLKKYNEYIYNHAGINISTTFNF